MKKIISAVALLMFVTLSVIAQPPVMGDHDRKEKMEALKVGYLTKELELTADEAKVFWPVYNQYTAELETIKKNRATKLLDAKTNFDSMSDADIAKTIENEFAYQQQELDLKKKYNAEFKKVLPMKKVAKFWVAEQKFKLYLLEQLKQKQDGKPGPGGPPGPAPK